MKQNIIIGRSDSRVEKSTIFDLSVTVVLN